MHSERIYFIAERITDTLNLKKDLNNDVQNGLMELHKELAHIHDNYLRQVEANDETPLNSSVCPELGSIANSCDDLLDRVTCNNLNPTTLNASDNIHILVQRIQNLYQLLLLQPSYTFVTGYNQNTGLHAQQSVGSTNICIYPDNPPKIKRGSRPKTYGHVQNREGIVGFNKEIDTLLSHLIHDRTPYVGILGMPGSGKTTLAKHLYHHHNIKKHFGSRIWVCISQSWNETDILRDILRQTKDANTKDEAIGSMRVEEIIGKLVDVLSSKLYLVVLDDIWSIDAWNHISPALPPSKGSKVLVTTRLQSIPKDIDSDSFIVELGPLNDKESYELLHKRTFHKNENPSDELVKLGKEMAKKCRGLPLAIVALAGILQANKNQSRWKTISETLMQNILKRSDSLTQGVVEDILEMSYSDLPLYLKPCVLYLSFFPEDYMIRAEHLIKMWIVECLIRHDMRISEMLQMHEEEKEAEAETYLEEMIQRYIIQDVKRNYEDKVKTFRVHDLIREMCIKIAKRKGFLDESHRLIPSFTRSDHECKNRIEDTAKLAHFERIVGDPKKSSYARSLISVQISSQLIKVELLQLFQMYRPLRILCLIFPRRSEVLLPQEIGNLIHLRYFELGGFVEILPSSIENLQNLWTPDLRKLIGGGVGSLNILKLKGLRHLYFQEWGYLPSKPLDFGSLHQLKTLWNVVASDWILQKTPTLSPSLEEIRVIGIKNEEQLNQLFSTSSIMSNNLRTLDLQWGQQFALSYSSNVELRIHNLMTLVKFESLTKLKLCGKIEESEVKAIVLPPNLIKLHVRYAKLMERDVIRDIGNSCPSLMALTLANNAYTGDCVCDAGSFPRLEKLKFKLLSLKRWTIERGAMPNLKHLTILDCCDLCIVGEEGQMFIKSVPCVDYDESRVGKNLRDLLRNAADVDLCRENSGIRARHWVDEKDWLLILAFFFCFIVVFASICCKTIWPC